MRNECDKEALIHDLLCGFRVGLNICRLEFQLLAGVPDGVYQQECAEVLHLAAILEEYADGGLVVCGGSRSRRSGAVSCGLRVGSRAGSYSLSLSGGISLCFAYQSVAGLQQLVDEFAEIHLLILAVDVVLDEFDLCLVGVGNLEYKVVNEADIGDDVRILTDNEEHILRLMRQHRKVLKAHHRRGALDGMHDTENLFNVLAVEGVRLFCPQKDLIKLFQQ